MSDYGMCIKMEYWMMFTIMTMMCYILLLLWCISMLFNYGNNYFITFFLFTVLCQQLAKMKVHIESLFCISNNMHCCHSQGKAGGNIYFSRTVKGQGIFHHVRELVNSYPKSVKSHGI